MKVGVCIPYEVEEKIAQMYLNNVLVKDIMKECDVHERTIFRVVAKRGIKCKRRKRSGEDHPLWKGGLTNLGYKLAYVDPEGPFASMRSRANACFEHRLVYAQYLGRPLCSDEIVHHINGVRDDNRLENLQLLTKAHAAGVAQKCANCGSTDILTVQQKKENT